MNEANTDYAKFACLHLTQCTVIYLATHNSRAHIEDRQEERTFIVLYRLQSVLRSLRERHQRQLAIRELSALNDHQLADIGVERGSLVDAVNGRLTRFNAI